VGRTLPPPEDQIGTLSEVRRIESEGFYDTCNIFYLREAVDKVNGFTVLMGESRLLMLGEDTVMGIRVRQAGFLSVYAPDVLVYHRVRVLTPIQWLIQPWHVCMIPKYVRYQPVIRRELLFLRYFMSHNTALFDLALLGATTAIILHPWFGLLTIPFIWSKLSKPGDRPLVRILRLGAGSARAAITFGVLVYGSIRARCLVI
jgi:GT2 family glycosyltransferase